MNTFEDVKDEVYNVTPWFDETIERCQEQIGKIKTQTGLENALDYWAGNDEDVVYIFYSALQNGVIINDDNMKPFYKALDGLRNLEQTKSTDEELFKKKYEFHSKIIERDGFVGTDPWTELHFIDNKIESAKKRYEGYAGKSPVIRKELELEVINRMAQKAAIEDFIDNKKLVNTPDNDVDKYADLEYKGKAPVKFTSWMNNMRNKGYY